MRKEGAIWQKKGCREKSKHDSNGRSTVLSGVCAQPGMHAVSHGRPDRLFHNFRASRSGNRRILCSSETSIDGFLDYNIVKGSVGLRQNHNEI